MNASAGKTLVLGFEGLTGDTALTLVPSVAQDAWLRLPVDGTKAVAKDFWRSVATGDSRSLMSTPLDGRLSFLPIWNVLHRVGRASGCVNWPGTFVSRLRECPVVTDIACRVPSGPFEAWLCPPSVASPEGVWRRFDERRVHWEDVTMEQVRELLPDLRAEIPSDDPLVRAVRTTLATIGTVQSAAMDMAEHVRPDALFVWHGVTSDWPTTGPLGDALPRLRGLLRACNGFLHTALGATRVVLVTRDAMLLSPDFARAGHDFDASRMLMPSDAGATLFEALALDTAFDRDGRSASGSEPVVWTHDAASAADQPGEKPRTTGGPRSVGHAPDIGSRL